MKPEEMNKRRTPMIVLNVKLNNLYAFKNFNANFTYPKKIVGSTIKDEFLPERPSFRYKKINIIFGANASGKTTFGRILMKIFNFISKKNYDFITETICDSSKEADFEIELASKNNIFYRIICKITPSIDGKYTPENIKLQIIKNDILKRDTYERCSKRADEVIFSPADNYVEELEKMEPLSWFFEYPNDKNFILNLPNKDKEFCYILKNTLKSLDPYINDVKISKDVENAYVINLRDKSIVLQNRMEIKTDLLSSGTKSGVAVAIMLHSMSIKSSDFFYCDELFSYIHTDIEKAILSVMIDFSGPYDQLFFTTHNTDILDMNLPKHSFSFLHKDVNNNECPIACIEASSLLKRSTDSLRNAVENDLFSVAPSVDLIYSISDYDKKE